MPENAFDVAIIGSGFSGSLLAIQLLRHLPSTSSIALIGKPGETGMGLAYSTRDPVHLLNVRAARMSLDSDDEQDFVAWLAARYPKLAPSAGLAEAYVPRGMYGEYVRDRLAEAMKEARGRVHAALFTSEVTGIERDGEDCVLELATGDTITARHACLCLGNAASRLPLPSARVDPAAHARIIEDPWRDRRLSQIAPDARLLFVGTGLTMVDQVMARRRMGHRGPLLAVSRHGRLPAVQPEVSLPPTKWQPPANNGRLSVLFRAIVDAARSAEASGGDWRSIVDGLRPEAQRLWQRLTPASRRRFFRHAESFWSVHRHRMAPSIGAEIAALHSAGSLAVIAGRLDRIDRAAGALHVSVRRRGSFHADVFAADWIVNCTGPGPLASPPASALVADLVASGLARSDSLGLGLDVSREGQLIGRDRRKVPNIYAIGAAGRARLLEITAAREIRDQTLAVATRIAAAKRSELFPRLRVRRPPFEQYAG
jgi:uncharacterized NAD(P)/FAD-binding protein YdhS